MKSRLFSPVTLAMPESKFPLEKLKRQCQGEENALPLDAFECLGGKDVITAKISDHHPILHHGVLFWNCMMQGAKRRAGGFNNAFGLIETDADYQRRLMKVAQVIMEITHKYPLIETIGLCEAPNKSETVKVLLRTFKQCPEMNRFLTGGLHKPSLDAYTNWGLLMFCDSKYKVSEMGHNFVMAPDLFDKLANRMQLWKLTHHEKEKYFALAHFPFGGDGDEKATEKTQLSKLATIYQEMINDLLQQYANKDLIFCADFNFNPYLLGHWKERFLDKIAHNNSVILAGQEHYRVTVEGVLLSQGEKQKYFSLRSNPSLFSQLQREHTLSHPYQTDYAERSRLLLHR